MFSIKRICYSIIVFFSLSACLLSQELWTPWSYTWYYPNWTPVNEFNTPHRCGIRIENGHLTVMAELNYLPGMNRSLNSEQLLSYINWRPANMTLWELYQGEPQQCSDLGSEGPWRDIAMGTLEHYEYTSMMPLQAGNTYRFDMSHWKRKSNTSVTYVEWPMSIFTDQFTFQTGINGPDALNEGEAGIFTASYRSDICPPTMYKWYKQDIGSGIGRMSLDMTPPCEDADFVLYSQGSNLNSITVVPDCGSFKLKLILMNILTGYQEEAIKTVDVFVDDPFKLSKSSSSDKPIRLSIANAPNPFGEATEIQYALPESGPVNMVIYNLLGETIRELLNITQESGFHQISWDGTNSQGQKVETGVYFCRILTETGVASAKIMVAR